MIAEEVVKAVISLLTTKNQLSLLPQIAQALTQASLTQTDPNLATVTAAVPVSSPQQLALKLSLCRIFNRPVRLKLVVDPGLVGGLRISLAGKVIDTSLAQQLTQLKETIIHD